MTTSCRWIDQRSRLLFLAAPKLLTAIGFLWGGSSTLLAQQTTLPPPSTIGNNTAICGPTTIVTTAGSSVTVTGTNVSFVASSQITFNPGFSSEAGATFTASIGSCGSTTQYLLTTSANTSTEGSISPGSEWVNSGSPVSVSASPSSGYQFTGFSGALSGTTTPQTLTVTGTMSVTANFAPTSSSGPLTLPTLKGVNYFPRGHAWWSMFYDWYSYDSCTSTIAPSSTVCSSGSPGQTVAQMAASDLEMLAANGFNFIHLYLWDQDIVQDTLVGGAGVPLLTSVQTAPGFVGWDVSGGPQSSPGNPLSPWGLNDPNHNQWTALQAFISLAKANGIWVCLEFAADRPTKEVDGGYSYSSVGTNYGTWVGSFISALQAYQDVLIYGVSKGISGPAGSTWQQFWTAAYTNGILPTAQQTSYPGGRALIMVDSGFSASYGDIPAILSGYQWNWQTIQSAASYWQVDGIYPDLYALEMYNANAGDLQAALNCLAGIASVLCAPPAPTETCGTACTIPFSKMVVTEVSTGSSFAGPPIGNGTPSSGDAVTPTSTAAGQAQWLTDTLCVFNTLGITRFAWFGLYDSASWWEDYLNYSGTTLAWDGYWGLSSEVASYGNKPAWSAMLGYPGNCPSSALPPTPVLALSADATYYTVNDTAYITWGVSDVTSISLSEPPPYQSYSGIKGTPLGAGSLLGSWAFDPLQMQLTTSQITLTGANTDVNGGTSSSQSNGSTSINVTVGLNPIVNGIVEYQTGQSCNLTQSPTCTLAVCQQDTVEIYGLGFDPTGGNTVELTGPGTVWLYSLDGSYFWDGSRTQINATLYSAVSTGLWTVTVRNPNSGTPASSFSINVVAPGSC